MPATPARAAAPTPSPAPAPRRPTPAPAPPPAPTARPSPAGPRPAAMPAGPPALRLVGSGPAPAPAPPAPGPERSGFGEVLDFFAEKANYIPGFRMLTVLLGFNPISRVRVERNAANILRALIEFMPGGALITQALENHGILARVAAWVEQQLGALAAIGGEIGQAISAFLDTLSLTDIFDLSGVWNRATRIFTDPIGRLIDFAKTVAVDILKFIKEAILLPLARLAEGTRGYDLLKAVLGEDPITGKPVPRNAETLIGGFMKLIGQEEIWENTKKAKAIPRAYAWFQGALEGLLGFVRQFPAMIVGALQALTIADVVLLPRAFVKIFSVFGGLIGRFFSWAAGTVWNLLEIIFDVVSPAALRYIKKTGAALKSILKNPLPFVGNLVKAAKLGFQNFMDHFGAHLKAGLIDWLTGSLPGVYIPKAFELGEIVTFVFSVLGISWQKIRGKLVKVVGETAVKAMETGFEIVVVLVTQGPAAAWEKIKEQLTNLKDMVIGGITDFVVDTIVKKAVPKLISMFIPGAGFISAILSIYDTIMVFVQKISTIVQVVTGFIDSIVNIAAGVIDAAAKKVETTLAKLLSLAISFLAGFLGLGNIAEKIMGVIKKLQATVDKAIDALIAWIVKMAKAVFSAAKAGVKKLLQWWKKEVPLVAGAVSHVLKFDGSGGSARLAVHSDAKTITEFVKDFLTSKAPGAAQHIKRANELNASIATTQKNLVAAEQKNDGPQVDTLSQKLDKQLDELGDVLKKLMNADKEQGSEENPVVIDYPKRRASAYPVMFVGPRVGEGLRVKQEWLRPLAGASKKSAKEKLLEHLPQLEDNPGFKAWSGEVNKYEPTVQEGLGGKRVGLSAQFASLSPGKLLVYDEKGGTGGGGKINDVFKPYGFVPAIKGGEAMDGDHVMERQLGGPDELENLWPLPATENRSSGSTLKGLMVKFRDKGNLTDMTIHAARVARGKILHLLIRSVKG